MYSFTGLIRRTPPPTFSDTAITDRHSDTTIFQLRAHWVRISWSSESEKIVRTHAPGGSGTLGFLRARRAPYPLGQALLCVNQLFEIQFLYGKNGPNHMSGKLDRYRATRPILMQLGQQPNNDDVISCFFSKPYKHGRRVSIDDSNIKLR